jgi:hypothetical protein
VVVPRRLAMTEAEWLRCEDPHRLIDQLGPDFSRRKLRHFVCLCVRHQLSGPVDEWVSDVFAFAERLADDQVRIEPDEWAAVRRSIDDRSPPSLESRRRAPRGLIRLLYELPATVGEDIYDEAHEVVVHLKDDRVDVAVPLGLLRDIFGNPYRPVSVDPSWLTSTVLALAEGIYADRAFDRLPILADALQDAGCDNHDVLDHCRGDGPHVKGCWVVDLLTGRT